VKNGKKCIREREKVYLTDLTGVTSTDSQLSGTPAASNIFWTLFEISGPIPSPQMKIK